MPDLAEAMREYMQALAPPIDIDAVRQRPPSRDRRRVAMLGVAAVVLLVAATVTVLMTRDDRHGRVRTIDRPNGARPASLIGTDQNGRLVIFDPNTGVESAVVTTQQPGGGAAGPSTTGDGRYVYF